MMEQQLTKILGAVPFPFSISDQEKTVHVYYNSSMAVMDTRQEGVDFPLDSHEHASYEFFMPISSLAVIKLEEDIFPAEFCKVIPINAEQTHGSAGYYKNCRCFGWHIDADLIKSLAGSMYGKPQVTFSNDFIRVGKEVNLLLRWFMEECKNKQAGSCFILDALVTQLTITLLRQVKNSCSYLAEKKVLSAKPNIERTIEYLHDSYRSHYSLQDVARIANMSPYHFIRLFKNQTGKTPYAYLLDIKIERAKELLRSKKYTVTEVCFLCGFNNVSHFATLFKRKVGVSPSEYSRL
ncbi:MAG: helix-turn-helix transcriptional regulator [Peptococcaceae bacterium]|nr:helix-turn-helix transcriptional regulator [Peptococcaceae bacterium]